MCGHPHARGRTSLPEGDFSELALKVKPCNYTEWLYLKERCRTPKHALGFIILKEHSPFTMQLHFLINGLH